MVLAAYVSFIFYLLVWTGIATCKGCPVNKTVAWRAESRLAILIWVSQLVPEHHYPDQDGN
jgi:hypothetical protein